MHVCVESAFKSHLTNFSQSYSFGVSARLEDVSLKTLWFRRRSLIYGVMLWFRGRRTIMARNGMQAHA